MKSKTVSTTYAWLTLIVIVLSASAALGWVNLQVVNELPPESEFQSKWETTRDFIFRGENPYTNPDQTPFTAPLPAILLHAPFALIEDYQIARAAWITISQAAAIIFALLCIRITAWESSRWLAGLFVIFVFAWFPAISVYVRGSEAALIAVFFASAILTLQHQNDEIAGIFLGLAALQPRLAFIGILLLLLWAGSHRRWMLHLWTGIVILFLSGIGMIFLASWPIDFFWSVLRNINFDWGMVIINTTTRWWPGVGLQIGWGIFFLAAGTLSVEWWLAWGKNEKHLAWVLALTLILSIWIGIEINLDHVFMLTFSLFVIFMAWNRRWSRSGQIYMLLTSGLLLPGLWWAFRFFDRQGIGGDMNPILMLGFPFMLLIGLYWVRWWFLRPTYLDDRLAINR